MVNKNVADAKRKQKEYDRRQRYDMKDSQKLEITNSKKRFKYTKKTKGTGIMKSIVEMTPREHRAKGKQWKINSKNYNNNRKKTHERKCSTYLNSFLCVHFIITSM